MKPEDFLMALNDADDAYVKKAGIKGGYMTLHQETSIQNTESQGVARNFRQETAKQRRFKAFCTAAAACLAVVALSWGGLALLKQDPASGTKSPAGTNFPVSTPSPAAETTQAAVPEAETNLIWVGDWQASCVAGEDPYQVVLNTIRKDPNIRSSCTLSAGPLDEGEQAQLLEQAGTGELSLQKGLGAEIAALAASEPERVAIVRAGWLMQSGSSHTPNGRMVQYFFILQGEDGFWRILDATERQIEKFSKLTQQEIEQLLEQYGVFLDDERITYTPGTDASKTMNSLWDNLAKLSTAASMGGSIAGAYGGAEWETAMQREEFRTMRLQNGKNEEILELLEAGSKDIEAFKMDIRYDLSTEEGANLPQSFGFSQIFFLTKNADGLWEILDASYPK